MTTDRDQQIAEHLSAQAQEFLDRRRLRVIGMCGECRHWVPNFVGIKPTRHHLCKRVRHVDPMADVYAEKEPAITTADSNSGLMTRAEFGCSLFEQRDDETGGDALWPGGAAFGANTHGTCGRGSLRSRYPCAPRTCVALAFRINSNGSRWVARASCARVRSAEACACTG